MFEKQLSRVKIDRPKTPVEVGVKPNLVASVLLLLVLLAGCANLPMDQACRAGIEKESEVLYTDDHRISQSRSTGFSLLLSAAAGNELVGDYQSCLKNLNMARSLSHGDSGLSHNYVPPQDTYPPPIRHKKGPAKGPAYDAAHHALGHLHHHGH